MTSLIDILQGIKSVLKSSWFVPVLILLLLFGTVFFAMKWYGEHENNKAIMSQLQQNTLAFQDSLRKVGDYNVKYVKELILTDSLSKAQLSKYETRLIAEEELVTQLQNQTSEVKHDTVYEKSNSYSNHIFNGLFANGLFSINDSVGVSISKFDSNTYRWNWNNQFSIKFLRNIVLKQYLTRNAAGMYSMYVKPENLMDTSFIKIEDINTIIDPTSVQDERTFLQKVFLNPELGYDIPTKTVTLGMNLLLEPYNLTIGYTTGSNLSMFKVGYMFSIYNIFH